MWHREMGEGFLLMAIMGGADANAVTGRLPLAVAEPLGQALTREEKLTFASRMADRLKTTTDGWEQQVHRARPRQGRFTALEQRAPELGPGLRRTLQRVARDTAPRNAARSRQQRRAGFAVLRTAARWDSCQRMAQTLRESLSAVEQGRVSEGSDPPPPLGENLTRNAIHMVLAEAPLADRVRALGALALALTNPAHADTDSPPPDEDDTWTRRGQQWKESVHGGENH